MKINGSSNRGFFLFPAGTIFLALLMMLFCAPDAAARSAAETSGRTSESVSFIDIQGRDWVLEEVIINFVTTHIDRTNPMGDLIDMSETFTLRFDEQYVGGVGYPNRFFGPYTTGADNDLSIGMLAATLMMAIFELDSITEQEYFAYLANTKSWTFRAGKLELNTSGANGETVVLVYH